MKNNFSQIQKQYRFDEERNAYLIEVSLDDYDDVYDEWDPAPFKKRFIQDQFDDFIVLSAEDIPLKYNINVILYIPEDKKDLTKETSVASAYRNYYSYELVKVDKSRARLRKKNISYFLLSFSFLAVGYLFRYGQDNFILNVLQEGVLIGGWVFLWEFFTNIFIKRRELVGRYKLYKRLFQSEIRFVYTSTYI